MIQVKVARLPGRVIEVALNEGDKVKDAIREAGITDYQGADITIDEEGADLDRVLADGDSILIANKNVKGAA